MSPPSVRVSWQHTADGSPLGKAHTLNEAGELRSASARRYVEGCIAVETRPHTLDELLAHALDLGGSAHRYSGTHEPGTDGQVLRAGGEAPGATADFLAHREGPGVLCIDIDKGQRAPWLTHEDVRAGLVAAIPWLAGVGLLVMDSSGSCIALDGAEVRGPGGFHVYAFTDSAPQIPRLLVDGHRRCFLAGLGRLVVTEGAGLVERSPIDLALRAPTQPDFMVPHLGSPRLSRSRAPTIFPGGRIPAGAAFLSPGEVKRYETIAAGERAVLEPARRAKVDERARKRGKEAHAKLGGELAHHVAAARLAYENQCLPAGFPVPLGNGEFATVAELLADRSRAGEGWSLPDPLDPDYGPRKAKLLADKPIIRSQAHGGRDYHLGPPPKVATPGDLVVSSLSLADVRSPPRERFVLGRMLPFGKASVLFGPSGIGKSAAAAQLALACAAGAESLWGLSLSPGGGPVLVYTVEDTLDDWKRKAAAIDFAGGLDVEGALPRLRVIDQTEGTARLVEIVTVRTADEAEAVTRYRLRPTHEQDQVIQAAKDARATFILVETASRLVDDEDNTNLAALVGALGRIGRETGAAVLVSHHPTKVSSKENDSAVESARGGGAFIANARNAISLFPADPEVAGEYGGRFPAEDVLVLAHGKSTSSTKRHAPIVLVRTETPWGAVLRLPEEAALNPDQAKATAARVEAERERDWESMRRLYAVVESMLPLGRVSMSRLRDRVTDIGVSKRRLEAFVTRAVKQGVLRVEYGQGRGGGSTLLLGHDPRKPIGGATSGQVAPDTSTPEGGNGLRTVTSPVGRESGTTSIVPTSLPSSGSREELRDELGQVPGNGTTSGRAAPMAEVLDELAGLDWEVCHRDRP